MTRHLEPPGLGRRQPGAIRPEQEFRRWADLLEATEQLLLAGLRREVGPDGDVRAAYRQWYARHQDEHEEGLRRLAAGLYCRGVRHGR
jgi:hypothetical protein